MRDGIVVEVEADIGRLACLDRGLLDQGIGVIRQRQQPRRLCGEGLADADGLLPRAAPVRRNAAAPVLGLDIERLQIAGVAAGEEVVAHVADGAFDAALLVASRDGNRPGFEAVVTGEADQGGMETDGVASPLQNSALQIVVEQNPRYAVPCREGLGMTAQEVLHARIEKEAQKNLARVAQDHDESHQRTARAADGEMAEMPPINLGLLARQGAQAQVSLRRGARPMACNEVAEVIGTSAVTTLAHHRIEPAGGEGWKRLQGLADERQIGIDPRRTRLLPGAGQSGLGENPRHRAMVHMQLPGDGSGPPLLDMVIAQDLRLKVRGNGHAQLLCGLKFEDPSGGAGSFGERIPGSGSRTSGIAMLAVLQSRPEISVCLPPPGPVTANHPAVLAVNPDASRFFAGLDNCGPAKHGRYGHGGSSGSAGRRRVARCGALAAHSLRRNRSGPCRSRCR